MTMKKKKKEKMLEKKESIHAMDPREINCQVKYTHNNTLHKATELTVIPAQHVYNSLFFSGFQNDFTELTMVEPTVLTVEKAANKQYVRKQVVRDHLRWRCGPPG